MADGIRIGAVVLFVHNLDRSERFYRDVLALEVTDRSTTAVLLTSDCGAQLILRAIGENAPHPLGSAGMQYVLWATDSRAEFDRCERALEDRKAHLETRRSGASSVVEGRDPDDGVIIIQHHGPGSARLSELPPRIYAW